MRWRKMKLTREERQIEAELERGEWVDAPKEEFDRIAKMLELRRKDSVLNIRINSQDLKQLKQKAKKLGIKYQTFISEILHRVAHR